MVRDFSQSALDRLLRLISEINEEQWFNWTDALGDWWYGTIFYSQEISNCLDDIEGFHKRMLDKNDTSADKLRAIFDTVRQVDQNYATRFSAALVNLQNYLQAVQSLSKAFMLDSGTSADIKKILSDGFDNLETQVEILRQLSTEGLTNESIRQQDGPTLVKTLESVCRTLAKYSPSVGIDTSLEIPIGPGLVFYYKTGASWQGGGDTSATINTVLQDQKHVLSGMEFSSEYMGIAISGSMDLDRNLTPGIAYTRKIADNTELSTKYEIGFNSISVEETVTTTLELGTIYSTAGFKSSRDDRWTPVPVPVTVPVEVPAYEIPRFDPDWETVAIIAVGIVIVGGIILCPEAAPLLLAF